MLRALLFIFLIYNLHSVEITNKYFSKIFSGEIFIGQGSNCLYFAIKTTSYEWDWGLNYCHNIRLMPASIETEEDHQLITNFLNTSTSIEDEFRFLWLPATDHRREGTFQWMWNMKNVNVGSWAPGMPSINRTANCLAMNRYGQFMEESCYNSGRNYYTLCEAQNFYHGEANHNNFNKAIVNNHDAETTNKLADQQLQTLILIGTVGNKMYFADNQSISWTESLDLCHSAGLRLATPEQPEELDFIREYVVQQDAIFYLGGTDRLSVSCLKSNTEFRWFYSGNPIANQTNLSGNSWWYHCTLMTPDGFYSTGCAKGGGAFARTICEVTLQ